MHNLLRCRRGSAAFATVVALVPLIGVVALGGEAGSWYVTKQHAQNAADAAAYSGALRVACSISGDVAIVIQHKTMSIVANNLPHGMRSATLATRRIRAPIVPPRFRQVRHRPCRSISRPADRVRAIVSQHQPGYLSRVLGLFPDGIDIRAQAIAEVQNPKDLCFLGLRTVK